MELENNTHEGMSRRTIVKGAAWSIPVMAAAVAAPAAIATGGPGWDVTVQGNCDNNYDLSLLEVLVGASLVGVVEGLLAAPPFNLQPGALREFTVTATEGTVIAGTSFTLDHGGLLNLALIGVSGFLSVSALDIIAIDANSATITLLNNFPEGQSFTLDLYSALLDVGAASNITLTLNGSDNPTDPGSEGSDSGSVSSLVAAGVNLNTLGVGATGTLAVQVCGPQ
jgi:hypothetical protein